MGDGGFMMCGQELATIKAGKLRGIAMVFDNGIYGTIRMHQERDYPNRHMATDLTNPDFVKLAESYGLKASLIDHHAQFESAFLDALKRAQGGGFTLLHIKNDPEQITTGKTMSAIRGD
jgi:acetolactate synthase-1/2/3 large subunit